jgi:hypothetical protein
MHIILEEKKIDTGFKRIIFSYLPMPDESGVNSIDLGAIKIEFMEEKLQYYDMNYIPRWMEMWCVGQRCFYGCPYSRFDCSEVIDRLFPYASFDVRVYFDDRCEFDKSVIDRFYLEFFDQFGRRIEVRDKNGR